MTLGNPQESCILCRDRNILAHRSLWLSLANLATLRPTRVRPLRTLGSNVTSIKGYGDFSKDCATKTLVIERHTSDNRDGSDKVRESEIGKVEVDEYSSAGEEIKLIRSTYPLDHTVDMIGILRLNIVRRTFAQLLIYDDWHCMVILRTS